MTKTWWVKHHKHGAHVLLTNLDRRARVWGVLERLSCTCRVTNRQLVWKIPLGKPRRDEDGELSNSLGQWLWEHDSTVAIRAFNEAQRCVVMELPVTDEQAQVLDPDTTFLYEP